ncbi:MAG: tryptophan--tRNA ligase [Bacteroidota bacterium]|nr:tryptophan--tRNA ligase [Bacteroidota bacterium]
MNNTTKRVLSGIQPTNEMHFGNYFGAVANWVDLQEKYDCLFCVVDLHAITTSYDPKELRKNSKNMFVDILACGIDPEKSTLFIQSMVPEHTELTWYLNCVTSYGQLSRMTQFKDKSEVINQQSKEKFVSAGLFTYPILQAADILIYKANYVPVGRDQKQHLELTRNIADRFNNQFGKYFPLPEPLFTKTSKILSLADPSKKMSKSLGPKHFVGLFEDENKIRKKVRSAVTDIGNIENNKMSQGVEGLFEILKACNKTEIVKSLIADYDSGQLKYKELKDNVSDALVELSNKFKERKKEILSDENKVKELMIKGSEKARVIAKKTIEEVKQLNGLA